MRFTARFAVTRGIPLRQGDPQRIGVAAALEEHGAPRQVWPVALQPARELVGLVDFWELLIHNFVKLQ